jgi:hypothetical protein
MGSTSLCGYLLFATAKNRLSGKRLCAMATQGGCERTYATIISHPRYLSNTARTLTAQRAHPSFCTPLHDDLLQALEVTVCKQVGSIIAIDGVGTFWLILLALQTGSRLAFEGRRAPPPAGVQKLGCAPAQLFVAIRKPTPYETSFGVMAVASILWNDYNNLFRCWVEGYRGSCN